MSSNGVHGGIIANNNRADIDIESTTRNVQENSVEFLDLFVISSGCSADENALNRILTANTIESVGHSKILQNTLRVVTGEPVRALLLSYR